MMEVLSRNGKFKHPLTLDCDYYILLETSGSNISHDEEKLMTFLETLLSEGWFHRYNTQYNVWLFKESDYAICLYIESFDYLVI